MDGLLYLGLWNAALASALALLIVAVGFICKRPVVLHVLWLLVLIKLVAPPLWPVEVEWTRADSTSAVEPADFPALHSFPARATIPPSEVAIDSTFPPPSLAPANSAEPPPPNIEPQPAAIFHSIPGEPADPELISREWPWVEIVLAIWASGTVLCWVLTLFRVFRFHRVLRQLKPAPDELQSRLRYLSARLGVKRSAAAYLVAAPISPLIWAFGRRARLLLPTALWESLSNSQRDLLLAHELAHLCRRDHWLGAFKLFVVGLYWWLPVAWYARRRLEETAEMCCDGVVLSAFPESAPEYATTLVDCASFVSKKRLLLPAGANGIGPAPLLRRRLKMILNGKTPCKMSWVSLGLLVIAAAILLPLWPSPVEPAAVEIPLPNDSQAESPDRDFERAVIHETAGHPGSAHFFYEIVKRKYPGTVWAEKAEAKLSELSKAGAATIENQQGKLPAKDAEFWDGSHVPIPLRFIGDCKKCHAGLGEEFFKAHGGMFVSQPPVKEQAAPNLVPAPAAAQKQQPMPAPALNSRLGELRVERELLEVKLEMEVAKLKLAETELAFAQKRLTEEAGKGLRLIDRQQEVATKEAAFTLQRAQVKYVEIQIRQLEQRYQELERSTKPPPSPNQADAKKDVTGKQLGPVQSFTLKWQPAMRVAHAVNDFFNRTESPADKAKDPICRVTYDDATNTVHVQATLETMPKIAGFIAALDRPDESKSNPKQSAEDRIKELEKELLDLRKELQELRGKKQNAKKSEIPFTVASNRKLEVRSIPRLKDALAYHSPFANNKTNRI